MKKTYQTPQSESIGIESDVMLETSSGSDAQNVYNQTTDEAQMSKRKGPWKATPWEEE